MTNLVCTVAALLCASAVEGPALGKPAPAPVYATSTALDSYVDQITIVEGIGQASAMTALHRRKTHLTR